MTILQLWKFARFQFKKKHEALKVVCRAVVVLFPWCILVDNAGSFGRKIGFVWSVSQYLWWYLQDWTPIFHIPLKKTWGGLCLQAQQKESQESKGGGPIITRVAKECKISCAFVWKIEGALIFFERAIDPDIERAIGERTVGPGVFTIDDLDACLIIILYEEEPCWGLENYQQHLLMMTESEVSKSTISQLKKKASNVCAGLRGQTLFPLISFG